MFNKKQKPIVLLIKSSKILVSLSGTEILWIIWIMTNLTCSIFLSFNNFFIIVFTYIKMSKDSRAKYYQNNKKRLQKKARERYQNLSKEEKEKINMVVNNTKIYQKMKNKSWLSTEKILIKKCLIIIIRNYFHLENLVYYLQVFWKECRCI